jgi:hypothetical protein
MPKSLYRAHQPVAAVKSSTTPTIARIMPRTLLMPAPAKAPMSRPAPATARTARSSGLSFFLNMRSLPFESIKLIFEFAAHDLVDKVTGLDEASVNWLPAHLALITVATNQPFTMQNSQVLGHV